MRKRLYLAAIILVLSLLSGAAIHVQKKEAENVAETAGQSVSAEIDTTRRTDIQTRKAIREKSEGEFTLEDVSNILLIGVDNDNLAGMNELGNADGILLLTINKNTRQLVLTSFMRDTRVLYPQGYGKKLTTVYHEHGVEALIEALEINFQIPIDNYILVNYLDVVDIVDSLGGFTVHLTESEIHAMSGKISNINQLVGAEPGSNSISREQAGELCLNGVQTAAYLRIRPGSTNYDSGRTARARSVVMMILEKAKNMSKEELLRFADTFFHSVQTGMSDQDKLTFLYNASSVFAYDIVSGKIPLDGAYTNSNDGNAYVIPDFEVNNAYLYELIYEGKHKGEEA